mmetsp:Transcript_25759/g.53976  ORF Transcript_25759/g.53976 Transcript_25759/m.53976 type:complete len:231 (-) Transcript_25759:43-735(-)
MRRRLAHAQLEPLDHVAHRHGLRPAVDEVLDLLIQRSLELSREHLCGRAHKICDHFLEGSQLRDASRVGARHDRIGDLKAKTKHLRVDVALGHRCRRQRGLALVLGKVREEWHLLMRMRTRRDLLFLQLLDNLGIVVLKLSQGWPRTRACTSSATTAPALGTPSASTTALRSGILWSPALAWASPAASACALSLSRLLGSLRLLDRSPLGLCRRLLPAFTRTRRSVSRLC